jgi:hypothetical protein
MKRLGRPVPDGVGAPDDAIRTEGPEQLAQDVGRLCRPAEDEVPRAPELGVDVALGPDAGCFDGGHQPVDAVVGRCGVIRALFSFGVQLVPRVVDDEIDVGIGERRWSDVPGGRRGDRRIGDGPAQALVAGHDSRPEGAHLLEEGHPDLLVVEEPSARR